MSSCPHNYVKSQHTAAEMVMLHSDIRDHRSKNIKCLLFLTTLIRATTENKIKEEYIKNKLYQTLYYILIHSHTCCQE